MKRLWTSFLAMLLVFAILIPASAIAEELEIEQNVASDESLELPEDAAVLDLVLNEVIVLDGLQSPQDSQGNSVKSPERTGWPKKLFPKRRPTAATAQNTACLPP